MRRHCGPLLILILLPICANAVALSGFFDNNPTLQFIGLAQGMRPGWLPGPMTWLDPSVGYIVQPLGHLAASDWLRGVVPWWNPFSGMGMPLAVEMQGLAFFMPFVLLLLLHNGWLLLRIVLQILCGTFAYGLLLELDLTLTAAVLGGALYALSLESTVFSSVCGLFGA